VFSLPDDICFYIHPEPERKGIKTAWHIPHL